MLRPKKTIPALVIGAMALFGCGDDNGTPGTGGTGTGGTGGGGTAGTGGAGGGAGGMGGMTGTGGTGGTGGIPIPGALADALDAWCMNYADCYAVTFDYCLMVWDLFPLAVDPACFSELTSYFNCGSALDCNEFIMEPNSCADEEAAFCACCNTQACQNVCAP